MDIVNISEMLKTLIELYDFNRDTLSKYLGISVEQIEAITQGSVDCLPDEPAFCHHILTKIGFLYFGAIEDKDLKLSSFLEVFISYHNLSKRTMAKMAGVGINDIERILSDPFKRVSDEIRYKVAVTVMVLRFFLKECESK